MSGAAHVSMAPFLLQRKLVDRHPSLHWLLGVTVFVSSPSSSILFLSTAMNKDNSHGSHKD